METFRAQSEGSSKQPDFIRFDTLPRAHGPALVRGLLRATPEDFMVEEILSFEPDDQGAHWLLRVRKTGANTEWVARQLARVARVPVRDLGYAGLKDRHAVAIQWFSLPLGERPPPDWSGLLGDGIEVLETRRHGRKLRRGAIAGNQFALRLRALRGDRAALAARLQAIAREGVPNYFGPQRFGRAESNLAAARALLTGAGPAGVAESTGALGPATEANAHDPGHPGESIHESHGTAGAGMEAEPSLTSEGLAAHRFEGEPNRGIEPQPEPSLGSGKGRRLSRHHRGLLLSAARSALFNQLLARRVELGNWHQALPGERLQLAGSHSHFLAEAVDDAILARLASGDLSPTGPLCGAGAALTSGAAAELEARTLAPWVDWIDGLARAGLRAERRALILRPRELTWVLEDEDCLLLRFRLPAGGFATSVLRELADWTEPQSPG